MAVTAPGRRLASIAALGSALALSLALAACSGSASPVPSAGASASPVPSAEASPAPSGAPSGRPSASPSIDLSRVTAVSKLSSYILVVDMRSGTATPTHLTVEATSKPAKASHYSLTGDSPMEFIVIDGQGSWQKQGTSWTSVPGSVSQITGLFDAMAPDTIVRTMGVAAFEQSLRTVGVEQKNGVAARHLHADASTVGNSDKSFPADGQFDLWMAQDGGYLVSLSYSGTQPATDAAASSSPVVFTYQIDVSRVNDPTITVAAPN